MLHTYAAKFNLTENLKIFCKLPRSLAKARPSRHATTSIFGQAQPFHAQCEHTQSAKGPTGPSARRRVPPTALSDALRPFAQRLHSLPVARHEAIRSPPPGRERRQGAESTLRFRRHGRGFELGLG
jgi:hypothetical protein